MADINVTLIIDDGLDVDVEVGTCVDHFTDLLDCPTAIVAHQLLKGNLPATDIIFSGTEFTYDDTLKVLHVGSNTNDGTHKITGKGYAEQETTAFANPVSVDANKSNNHNITITGDTTVNLVNMVAGMTGLIVLLNDGAGGHAVVLGVAFTKELNGSDTYDNTASKYNLITWYYDGTNVLYSITNEA